MTLRVTRSEELSLVRTEVRHWPRRLALLAIKVYRDRVSPALPPTCRFWPSCSEYAYEAVEKYGLLRGGWLAVKRLLRCHPFNPGGYDPVP
jgi:putative membrane protein insertion efficiency factor